METCRFLAQQGADAVICQHSHCPGCFEKYQGAHIVYGQGNLLFDLGASEPTWHQGFLVCLDAQAGGGFAMEIVPLVQSRPRPGAHRMRGDEETRFRRELEERSAHLEDVDFIEARWDAFCQEMARHYLRRFGAPHRLIRGLDRLTGVLQLLYSSRNVRNEQLNLIRCESHREALINILSQEPKRLRAPGFLARRTSGLRSEDVGDRT
jgi:poly-gamma-glutamate synthesis protein (capsule biosynthesis protein)